LHLEGQGHIPDTSTEADIFRTVCMIKTLQYFNNGEHDMHNHAHLGLFETDRHHYDFLFLVWVCVKRTPEHGPSGYILRELN
jgi:hypothetical protein